MGRFTRLPRLKPRFPAAGLVVYYMAVFVSTTMPVVAHAATVVVDDHLKPLCQISNGPAVCDKQLTIRMKTADDWQTGAFQFLATLNGIGRYGSGLYLPDLGNALRYEGWDGPRSNIYLLPDQVLTLRVRSWMSGPPQVTLKDALLDDGPKLFALGYSGNEYVAIAWITFEESDFAANKLQFTLFDTGPEPIAANLGTFPFPVPVPPSLMLAATALAGFTALGRARSRPGAPAPRMAGRDGASRSPGRLHRPRLRG